MIFKLIIFLLISNLIIVHCCNKSLCGSIVTKCLLTKSCKCEERFNVRCYKECFTCLEDLYQECCPCFEFCPKIRISTNNLNEISHIENLNDPVPELFEILTEENDKLARWTSMSFPVQLTFETADSKKKVKFTEGTKVIRGTEQVDNFHANCNVAFMSKCLSWAKCKSACISMGAASYRWFHNGCCECVGSRNCINYGIQIGQCSDCPSSKIESLASDLDSTSDNDNESSVYDNANNLKGNSVNTRPKNQN